MKPYVTNTQVTWKWRNREATGKVSEVHNDSITRIIKGSKITRNGSKENPAYLIEQKDGDKVLKLHSELEKP